MEFVEMRIMASIQENKTHYCGSCIVSPRVLLASAACTQILRNQRVNFYRIEAMPVKADGSTTVDGYAIESSMEHPTFSKEYQESKTDIDVGIFVVSIF